MGEPRTTAKVALYTNKGVIELDLWAKEAPLASRNFLQLCQNGYYNGTIFHRVVRDFIVQAGDPSGTGYGGESIYDETFFKDEFHSRLRFNRRGILGCANAGKSDTNGSQFIITLAATPELQNKNTMFGHVVGDSYFNVLKIAEAEVDDDERPLYPTKIESAEILIPYFDDLEDKLDHKQEQTKKAKRTKSTKRASINYEEEEEEEDQFTPIKKKIRPAHELLNDKELQSHPDKQASKGEQESKLEKSESVEVKSNDKRGDGNGDAKNKQLRKEKDPAKDNISVSGKSSRELDTLKMLESFTSKIKSIDSSWSSEEEDLHSD